MTDNWSHFHYHNCTLYRQHLVKIAQGTFWQIWTFSFVITDLKFFKMIEKTNILAKSDTYFFGNTLRKETISTEKLLFQFLLLSCFTYCYGNIGEFRFEKQKSPNPTVVQISKTCQKKKQTSIKRRRNEIRFCIELSLIGYDGSLKKSKCSLLAKGFVFLVRGPFTAEVVLNTKLSRKNHDELCET